ncbi:MAG: hypothetical protein HYR56_23460 [Acidobacteria bacterium]|nr:hypothetical protein [Acidobacteriota bacterium]MBI3422815.1 hypothetical protein [Acidobacteriota bacterium]
MLAAFSFGSRLHGLTAPLQTSPPLSSISAASFETALTPEGIAAGFGTNLAPGNATATTTPLPTTLGGVAVTVNGVNAGLFFVSAGQVNYLIPPGTTAGEAIINVLRNGTLTHSGKLTITNAAPAIFTANANGAGVPAAIALRVAANNAQTTETIAQLINNRWTTKAINLGPTGERVFLMLFLCGIRNLPNSDGNSGNGVAENVRVLIGGIETTPSFAAKQGSLAGVDQINVEVPRALLGRGRVKLTVLGGGFASNETEIEIAGTTGANPPTVTSFTPALATAGETLTINGTGFSANNLVLINGLETTAIESATAMQLVVRVPYGAETGRIAVRSTQGEGASTNNVALRTTISGLVTDTNGNPLPGVEVSYGAIKTATRNDGTYLLRDVSAGFGVLKLDPSKLPLTPAIQPYSKLATATANRDNLQATAALQPITGVAASIQTQTGGTAEGVVENVATAQRVLAPTGSISTNGLTFSFPDNITGVFPPGVMAGRLYLTLVSNSRTPAPFPAGVFSSAIAQLSPFGVKLTPGAKLIFPNPDGLPANAQARLYKLDQTTGSATLGQFVDVGAATVSADGTRIETGANAITETSIYFAALPRALTTVTGRVVDSDNVTPVRRALVRVSGQETFTDGNGSFTLRNVAVNGNNQISLEASFTRPTGRTDRVTRNNIAAVVNGLTRVTPDLVLPSPTTQPNLPPTLIAPPLLTVTEGQTRNIPLLVSDPDPNQTVTVTVSGATFATIVSLQNVFNLRLAPGANTAGAYTLTLRATDSQNAVTTQTVAVTVNRNRPPVLTVPPAQTATVGQQLAFNVFAVDPDVEQPLTLTATGLPSGAAFSQTSATTGRFTWTPSANQVGSVTVSFGVSDNGVPVGSDTKTVAITINGGIAAQWMTTGPTGDARTISSLLVSGGALYAGTVGGGVFRSTNGGNNWTPVNNGLGDQFIFSLAVSGTTLFAGTNSNGVYRTTDNGVNWTQINNGLSNQIVLSLAVSGTTLFAGTNSSGVYRTTDNGANWTQINNGLDNQFVYALAVSGTTLLAGTFGGVYRTTDNGTNWTPVNNGLSNRRVRSMAVSGTNIFVGTDGNGVYRTTDNGADWTQINNGIGNQIVLSLTVNFTTLFAGTTGGVYRTTDNGANWAGFNEGLTNLVVFTLAVSGNNLFAGTNGNGVFVRPLP